MSLTCPSCGVQNLDGADECAHCGNALSCVEPPKPTSAFEQSVMYRPLTDLEMTHVHALPPDASLETAIHTLNRQQVDLLEVVEDGQLVGVLSVRDIMMRVGAAYRQKLHLPVRQFMTPNPETLPPDAPIAFAINKMDVGGYRHVPVMQDGRVLGVVSVRDVIRYILKHSRQDNYPRAAT